MFAILAKHPGFVVALAAMLVMIVASAFAADNERAQTWLRRFVWYRRLLALGPAQLRFRGLVTLGAGVCCFAALLTLLLLVPDHSPLRGWLTSWGTLALGSLSVATITAGAALLERAAQLDGWR